MIKPEFLARMIKLADAAERGQWVNLTDMTRAELIAWFKSRMIKS